MMKRLVTLVAVLGLSMASIPQVEARSRSANRDNEAATRGQIHFTAAFTDEGTLPYGLYACHPQQTGVCKTKFDGTATYTGQLSTFSDYFGYLWFNPVTRGLEGESWDHHMGTLEGCGQGSFVLHQTNFEADPVLGFDPTTGTVHATLEWKVLKGSGTGDFFGATGSGTAEGDFALNASNSGTYTGTINCPRAND